MISIQSNTSPIDIGILEVSSQNRAVLSFFMDSIGAELFNEVDLNQASAYIIDFDFPGAKESWAKLQSTNKKPAIILSINEVTVPGSIWVKKPLNAKALTSAGEQLKKNLHTGLQNSTTKTAELTPSIATQNAESQEFNNLEVQANQHKAPKSQVLDSIPSLAVESTGNIPSLNSEKATVEVSADATSMSDVLTLEVPEEVTTQATIELVEPEVEAKDPSIQVTGTDELDDLLNSLNASTQNSEISDNTVSTETSNEEIVSFEPELEALETAEDPSVESIDNSPELTIETPEITFESPIIPEPADNAGSIEPELFGELIIDEPTENLQQEESSPIEQGIITEPSEVTEISKETSNDMPENSDSNTEGSTTEESQTDPSDIDLEAMLNELQQEMGDQGGASSGNTSVNNTQQEYRGTQAQERWALLCGDKNIVKSASDIKKTTFSPDEHLLSSLLNTLKEAKETEQTKRIKLEDLLIIVDSKTDTIYCDVSIHSEEYAYTCFHPLKDEKIRIHSLDESEIRMLHKKVETEPENIYSTEAFIWTTSLLTSRGRLPENTKTNKPIGLKSWPNLTRIEGFPHMMNIAAVFSKHPGSLLEVPQWLNIPQCYVFAFYNAALALEIIDRDHVVSKNNIKKISFGFGSKNKSENRGLFSRLLTKIKG